MNSAWDNVTRFMECGGGRCALNKLYAIMITVCASASTYGDVDGCVIMHIDTSLKDGQEVMYGVIVPPSHRGPRYMGIPLTDKYFPSPTPPMYATRTVPKTRNSAVDHVVPQIQGKLAHCLN